MLKIFESKHFKYDGYFFHPECDDKGLYSEGQIVVDAKIKFQTEYFRLKKPDVLSINKNSKIILKCNQCGFEEDITGIIKIAEKEDSILMIFK